MIHYHGTPMTPNAALIEALSGRHAFVSFAAPQQINLVSDVCQSFALDNGAFSAWRRGISIDWQEYYEWVKTIRTRPGFDWAVIPDVIDGGECANDELLNAWPLAKTEGVPVWHLHESLDRLERLSSCWHRIAFGSSGQYSATKTSRWWARMSEAFERICDASGRPATKIHLLRGLDPDVFRHCPASSADSANAGRNAGDEHRWAGPYEPPDTATKALVLVKRIEAFNSSDRWHGLPVQTNLWEGQQSA